MGILNVTPDSFSDGGCYADRQSAIDRALVMEDEGADIIDIGGESTRPGARPVSGSEEIERVVPVIRAVAKRVRVPISVDTSKASVAEAALDAGASIINDISGLSFDSGMAGVAVRYRVPVVIMHIKGTPRTMQKNPTYRAVVPEIKAYFHERIDYARKAGIPDNMIILDPGIGFGKTLRHNLEIIKRLDEFEGFQKPLLLGHSRKSFIGSLLNAAHPEDRLEGTAAVSAIGIMKGANIIRVHDVAEMVKVARVADAIKRAG
jgi:dihydropteroate synthase